MPLDYNYTGTEQSLSTSEVDGLQEDLDLKADQTSISNMDNTSDANKPVSNATQTALDLKSNIASPSFTGTGTFTKADNYGQIELTDSKPVAAGVGGGITMKGVYGGSGQTTGLAHIKAKKSNATVGDYHGDLSLSVREHGGGGYTEIIKLKGEDLKTIVSGAMEVAGNINLPTGSEFQINGTAIGGGGGGSSILKEYFSRYCFGQTVSTTNGNITLPNITVAQNITGSTINGWVDLTGSEISYQPPTGSTVVEYELDFYATCPGNDSENGFQMSFSIDGVEQSITRAKCNLSNLLGGIRGQTRYKFKTIIEINGTTDADKGFLSTWASAKTLKLRVMRIQTTDLRMHEVTTFYKENPVGVVNTILAPNIKICAY